MWQIQPLVALLGSTELPVLEHAAGALRNLSVNPENKAQMVAAGAIGPLIGHLMSHSPRIQLQAAMAVRNLSLHPGTDLTIVSEGGLEPLISMLYSSDESLQVCVCGACVHACLLEILLTCLRACM